MRILVLADIHSNWAALKAVPHDFDACVVAGDVVDYGSDPIRCLNWIREHSDCTIRGNHDHAVAHRVVSQGTSGYRRIAAVVREHHWRVLDAQSLKTLARLPVSQFIKLDQTRLFLIHATPRDPMDEYLGPEQSTWAQRLQGIHADIVCVGHTHLPFHLDLGEIQVLNPGSVGQPRDGDWRASYALIEDGQVSLHRVEYDLDEAIEHIHKSDLPHWAKALNSEILKRGGNLSREEMDSYQPDFR